MKFESYISSGCLSYYSKLVTQRGGNTGDLLQQALISEKALKSTDRLVPLQSFVYLLDLTARELSYSNLSLELANKQNINFLGPLSLMLYKAEKVADAIEIIKKYFKVTVSGVDVDVNLVKDTLLITFSCSIPFIVSSKQYQDYVLASCANTLWELVGRKLPLRGCYFTRNESNSARINTYSEYFGCPIAFNHRALTLTADAQLLNEPLEINEAIISTNTRVQSNSKDPFKNQVTEITRFLLASGLADIATVSKKLGYSKRTLQRRLHEHATSFVDILDNLRAQQAKRYLSDTTYRLTEISSLLGYNNLSSFTRSFKRWYGYEPSQERCRESSN